MGKRRKREAQEDAELDEAEEDAEEQVRDRRREGVDFSKFALAPVLADESLGGAFKPEDRGQYGDLSSGRPQGANRRWAAESEQKRHVDGYTPQMWEWFQEASEQLRRSPLSRAFSDHSPKTLTVSRNIKEGKPLGKRARRSDCRKYSPQRHAARGYSRFVRLNGRRVLADFSDRYDGYDPKIHDSRFASFRDEQLGVDDDSVLLREERSDYGLPDVDYDSGADRDSGLILSRPRTPDGNAWRRTGRRGRKSYPHPVDLDDRPRARTPDWRELEPLFKPVWEMIDSVLRKDERHAFVQRYLHGMSYDAIAKTARPKLSGRSQAYKLVKQARKKLEARVGKRIPNPFAKIPQ